MALRRGLWLGLCILCLDVSANLYEARTTYKRAVFALETGRTGDFRRLKATLRDYPLHPYLEYYDARSRISRHRWQSTRS